MYIQFVPNFDKKLKITLKLNTLANRWSLSAWANRAFWAILDQGLFALTNFTIFILLARWLTPSRYGAYIVTSSAFLILGIIHTSLITDPMLVFGARTHITFSSYYHAVKRLHWHISAVFSLWIVISTLICYLYGKYELTYSLAGLLINMPFVLFLWLSRRIYYVQS